MLGNWIKQTTTTTGTGNLSLSSISGYPVASSQFAVSERFSYAILDDGTGQPIERGIGYLDGSGNLVREKVRATYVSGTYSASSPSAVSLAAGTKTVICAASSLSALAARQGVWANSNKGYGDVHLAASNGTIPLIADRAYAVPFQATVDAEIDAVVFRITTAASSGKLIKAAIFSVGPDGLPGVNLAESSSIAADSTGIKAATFTRFTPPPVFFACILSDGAPTITASSTGVVLSHTMGFDSSLGACSFIHHVGATGLTFPTTWTPVSNISNGARPLLVARCI